MGSISVLSKIERLNECLMPVRGGFKNIEIRKTSLSPSEENLSVSILKADFDELIRLSLIGFVYNDSILGFSPYDLLDRYQDKLDDLDGLESLLKSLLVYCDVSGSPSEKQVCIYKCLNLVRAKKVCKGEVGIISI